MLGAVERDRLERVGLAHAAVFDALGSLLVQVPHQLVAVRFETDDGAGFVEQGRVEWDGVISLDLVGPPVGEGAATGTMIGDLRGDLVAFEHVLQRLDLETEAVGDAEQHEDLIGPVAVAMHLQIALEDIGQRFKPQVSARLRQVM